MWYTLFRRLGEIMDKFSFDERLFFDGKENAMPLYECFRNKVLDVCSDVKIEVKKTQISFKNRYLFCTVSFLPVKKKALRPNVYITITWGLDHELDSSKIDAIVEAYPNRFTHHMIIGNVEEVDDELISWIQEAANFSNSK